MRFRKRVFTYALFFVGLILVYLYIALPRINEVRRQNTNTLAIGPRAIVDSLSIPIAEPVELDGKPVEEIYGLRTDAALTFPWLLYTNYEPSYGVFGKIKGDSPWWGLAGRYFFGKGENSTAGLTDESRYILNPYLLIGAEFSGLSVFSGRPDETYWNSKLVTNAAISSNKVPFFAPPQNLKWWPGRRRVEVTYDLSSYLSQVNHWTARRYTFKDATFDLNAVNARDLNLNYMYVDYSSSIYIVKDPAPGQAVAIPQTIQHNDSCGQAGGCNTMNAIAAEFKGLTIQRLPAKLIIYLWNEAPAAITDTPDLTCVINIK